MRRWLSSTSRCGLYVFRWPTYTDIYWLVLTFLSLNFAESRMVRKLDRSGFQLSPRRGGEGREEGGTLLENSPSLSPIPKFPNFLFDSLLCPTINPFPLLSLLFFSFFFLSQVEHDFSFSKFEKDEEMGVDGNWSFDVYIFFSFRLISEIKSGK